MNKSKKTYMKGNNGITLIALIVTIIILIILAGISINLVLGENGIIQKAKEASEASTRAEAEEKLNMDIMDMYIDYEQKGKSLTLQDLSNLPKYDNNITEVNIEQEKAIVIYDGKYVFEIDKNLKVEYIGEAKGITISANSTGGWVKNEEEGSTIVGKIISMSGSITKASITTPAGTVENLNLNADGTYSYLATKSGNYVIDVEDDTGEKVSKNIPINIQVDGEAPKNINIDVKVDNLVMTLNVTSEENQSGIDYYTYKITNGEQEKTGNINSDGKLTITMENYGEYTVEIVAYDKVGNESENITKTVNLSQPITKILSYNMKPDIASTKKLVTKIVDTTGNGNDATVSNTITTTEDNKGITLNTNSSAEIDYKSDIQFPLTIETVISCESLESSVTTLFYDMKTKTTIAFYDKRLITTISEEVQLVNLPSDFDNGELKHIVVTYRSLTDHDVYINGIKQQKGSRFDYLFSSSDGKSYLGNCVKYNGFSGNLYNLRVYNKCLDESEVLDSYNVDINFLKSNVNNISRSNLVIEYGANNDVQEDLIEIAKITDNTKNGNDIIGHNLLQGINETGIIFNGKDTYGTIELQQNLNKPLTVELYLKCENTGGNQAIFIEPKSKTCLVILEDEFYVTVDDYSYATSVPSDFYDGNVKHIVISFAEIDNKNNYEMYINGQKLDKTKNSDYINPDGDNTFYIGKRNRGQYFKGILYEFNIYDGLLSESQIENNYNNMNY